MLAVGSYQVKPRHLQLGHTLLAEDGEQTKNRWLATLERDLRRGNDDAQVRNLSDVTQLNYVTVAPGGLQFSRC